MERQKYIQSLKNGSVLYRADAFSYDTGESSAELQEWVVRSIQKRRGSQSRYGFKRKFGSQTVYVNLTQRVKNTTWMKTGWASSISNRFKKQFVKDQDLPAGFYSTPLQALKYAISEWEDNILWCEEELKNVSDPKDNADWELELHEYQKELRLLKGRHTKLRKSRKAA